MSRLSVDGATGSIELTPDIVMPDVSVTPEMSRKLRAAAYREEADPLFFKAQRGEATIEEWQAKVAEIRARYPIPEE